MTWKKKKRSFGEVFFYGALYCLIFKRSIDRSMWFLLIDECKAFKTTDEDDGLARTGHEFGLMAGKKRVSGTRRPDLVSLNAPNSRIVGEA